MPHADLEKRKEYFRNYNQTRRPNKKEYNRLYYNNNQGKRISDQRAYYAAHADEERKKQIERRKTAPEKYAEASKKRHRKNPARQMYHSAKGRAAARGLEFNITIEDIVVPALCPVLGIPILFGQKFGSAHSPSLDRKDSSLGYVKGNIFVISWRANRLKSDASIGEIEKVLAYMRGEL